MKIRMILIAVLLVVAAAIGAKVAWPEAIKAFLDDVAVWWRYFESFHVASHS
jgi:hypothetical protein